MADIHTVMGHLDALAPLRLAGSWDNTGLLLEGDREVNRVFVTIDLTPAVLEEALAADADLVVAYHPTIFSGLKRLTRRSPHGPALLALLRRGMHLYSPHTALDAVQGGINDWLLQAFAGVSEVVPLEPDALTPHAGAGRRASVTATPARAALAAIKQHLNMDTLRVAGDLERTVRSVAVCPGSGATVFKGATDVDLVLTGEMGHHDVLAWASRGAVVVLTEHTNTERGYLPVYASQLRDRTGLTVQVSTADRDPLRLH